MTTLITGAGGFVGPHLAAALLRRGDRIIGIDIADSRCSDKVEFHRIDITDPSALRRVCRKVDSVIHTASVIHTGRNRKRELWRVNFDGTRYLLDTALAAGVARFTYLSSASVVYDGGSLENADESFPYANQPEATYAASKIAAEQAVLAANGQNDMATCAIRPHVVFGPGDQRFLPAILRMGNRWFPPVRIGGLEWLSDFTYIDDLVSGVLLADLALWKDGQPGIAAGQAYFVTNGEPIPFWHFIALVRDRLGLPPIRLSLPRSLAYAMATIRESVARITGGELGGERGLTQFAIRYLCSHHYFDIAKARTELGYTPKFSLEEGIERTCRALKSSARLFGS